MQKLTDSLSEQDWSEARSWADKVTKDPDNGLLLEAFEAWLGELPARAGAYRKILDTLALLPHLKDYERETESEHCSTSIRSSDEDPE